MTQYGGDTSAMDVLDGNYRVGGSTDDIWLDTCSYYYYSSFTFHFILITTHASIIGPVPLSL